MVPILRAARVVLFFALVSGSLLNAADVSNVSSTTASFELGLDFLVIVNGRIGELDGLKFILDIARWEERQAAGAAAAAGK